MTQGPYTCSGEWCRHRPTSDGTREGHWESEPPVPRECGPLDTSRWATGDEERKPPVGGGGVRDVTGGRWDRSDTGRTRGGRGTDSVQGKAPNVLSGHCPSRTPLKDPTRCTLKGLPVVTRCRPRDQPTLEGVPDRRRTQGHLSRHIRRLLSRQEKPFLAQTGPRRKSNTTLEIVK